MAEPFFRIEPEGFRFSYPEGDILISNTSLDRLGRSLVDIIAPGGGFLAEDLVNLKADSDRWKLSQQAALRDGVEAVEWADRLLVSYKHLEQAVPQVFGPKSIVNSSLYSGDGDGLWFSMGGRAEPEAQTYIVQGRIPEKYPTLLYGDGGNFKSFVALYHCICIAAGLPCLGAEVEQGPTAYLDYELDSEETLRRAYRLSRGLGLSRPPEDLYYNRGLQPLPVILDSLAEHQRESGFRLLVVDSLGPAAGDDPESARAVIPLFQALRGLSTAHLLVDHQSKAQTGDKYEGKTPFGSVYKFNLSRSVFQARKVADDAANHRSGLLLRHTKHNFGPKEPDQALWVCWDRDAIRFEQASEGDREGFEVVLSTEELVVEALADGSFLTNEQLAEATDKAIGTIGNTLRGLQRQGRVEVARKEGKRNVYRLAVVGVPDVTRTTKAKPSA